MNYIALHRNSDHTDPKVVVCPQSQVKDYESKLELAQYEQNVFRSNRSQTGEEELREDERVERGDKERWRHSTRKHEVVGAWRRNLKMKTKDKVE